MLTHHHRQDMLVDFSPHEMFNYILAEEFVALSTHRTLSASCGSTVSWLDNCAATSTSLNSAVTRARFSLSKGCLSLRDADPEAEFTEGALMSRRKAQDPVDSLSQGIEDAL